MTRNDAPSQEPREADTQPRFPRLVLEQVLVRRQLWGDAAVLLLTSAALLLVIRSEPSPFYVGTHQQWGFPPCTLRAWLGIPCPGCGVTTGLALMVRGRVREAFLANLLAPVLFVVGAYLGVNAALALLVRRRVLIIPPLSWHRRIGIYATAYVVIAWVLKIITYKVLMPPLG